MTSALHVLASVACDAVLPPPHASSSPGPYDSDTYPPSTSWRSSHPPQDVSGAQLCYSSPVSDSESPPQPLRQSNASNQLPGAKGCATTPSRRKTGKKHSPDAMAQLKHKQATRARRQLLLERAMRIKSLGNSPVNEHQLKVLRMVYDQITMYPPESWIVLMAIVIRRTPAQVRNFFSNHRQASARLGTSERKSIRTETLEGDRVRLRPLALHHSCPQWSDAFFEELLMVYDWSLRGHELNALKSA